MTCFFKRNNTLAVVIATFVLCVFLPRQCPETPGCQSCGSLLRPRALNLSLCARHWSCRRRRHLWSCLWCTHKTEIYVEQQAADSLPQRSLFGSHGCTVYKLQAQALTAKKSAQKKVRVAHEGHALTPTHRPGGTGRGGGRKLQAAAASVKPPKIKGFWQQCEPECENRLVVKGLVLHQCHHHY